MTARSDATDIASANGTPSATRWSGDIPRIRHLTGIRVHQLTLPISCAQALGPLPSSPTVSTLSESSKSPNLTASPERLHRHLSSASTRTLRRNRSASTATEIPHTRARAPTLAGEALEGGGSSRLKASIYEEEDVRGQQRRLARCFVVLKTLPITSVGEEGNHNSGRIPQRSFNEDKKAINLNGGSTQQAPLRRNVSRTSSSSSANSLPRRPTISTNSSSRSISTSPTTVTSPSNSATSSRTRTTSSPAPIKPANGSALTRRPSSSGVVNGHKPIKPFNAPKQDTRHSVPPPLLSRQSSYFKSRKHLPDHQPSITPFYISAIHRPSTHPRFINLETTSDFAPWLTTEELAASVFSIEVWYEHNDTWKLLEDAPRVIHLDQLRRKSDVKGKGKAEGPECNGLEFTFDFDNKGIYYIPQKGEDTNGPSRQGEGAGVVERSMRETRMKKGIGVGALHQLVNIQTVVADTQRGITAVQARIDGLLLEDADGRSICHDINEREMRISWVREKTAEVEKATREAEARIVLLKQSLEARRNNLIHAGETEQLLIGKSSTLENVIQSTESERNALLPHIHHYRSHHTQTLDLLFPISPLDPSILLYSILAIPLPIPTGPKDPAPPLTLPQHKVDERSTAAALGYVGIVVQLLSNILGGGHGGGGGVIYPITGIGSKSMVRDVVSVMQGPRSFPLYTKGVERYRFEYAVFLLNKNIEMLMQESQIRLMDIRHTLPNLKSLLLTLSSPTPPVLLSRRAVTVSSRQTSAAWSFARSPTATSLNESRVGSPLKAGFRRGRSSLAGTAALDGSEVGMDGESEVGREESRMMESLLGSEGDA